MSADLAAFLSARLDEDEALAREAPPRRWICTDNCLEFFTGDAQDWDAGSLARFERAADARHAVAHDPARVLREVAAKRALIAFLDPTEAPPGEGRYVAERALRLLGLPYADHPDYRAEWKA